MSVSLDEWHHDGLQTLTRRTFDRAQNRVVSVESGNAISNEKSKEAVSINEDVVGLIFRSSTQALLWWTVRLSRLTDIDPSVRCNALHVRLYTETRSGKRQMRSIPIDRLHGHVELDKLPSGGRVSAALGIQTNDGFIHIESCPPMLMPAKSSGTRTLGKRRWTGAPEVALSEQEKRLRTMPNLDGSSRLHGFSEHLPWEQQR